MNGPELKLEATLRASTSILTIIGCEFTGRPIDPSPENVSVPTPSAGAPSARPFPLSCVRGFTFASGLEMAADQENDECKRK
jgi:hypothetical protein